MTKILGGHYPDHVKPFSLSYSWPECMYHYDRMVALGFAPLDVPRIAVDGIAAKIAQDFSTQEKVVQSSYELRKWVKKTATAMEILRADPSRWPPYIDLERHDAAKMFVEAGEDATMLLLKDGQWSWGPDWRKDD